MVIHVAYIEPFCGGSHKQMVDLLSKEWPAEASEGIQVSTFLLPGKKWHWKLRTSALWVAQQIPSGAHFDVVFASSMFNLAELIALRPDLSRVKRKILYFHENQLTYPVLAVHRDKSDRDFQFGYIQIISSLVADKVAFNSKHNLESFTQAIPAFLNKVPGVPLNGRLAKETILNKSVVLPFPIKFSQLESFRAVPRKQLEGAPMHVVWPHRWEHDKNPRLFFRVLKRLVEGGEQFTVSVVGEQGSEVPAAFDDARAFLGDRVAHWGYLPSREAYLELLGTADVCVSTADHEFFGVAMLEAYFLGCTLYAPKKLAYPELYPKSSLYATEQQLYKRLLKMARGIEYIRRKRLDVQHRAEIDALIRRLDWDQATRGEFEKLLGFTEGEQRNQEPTLVKRGRKRVLLSLIVTVAIIVCRK